MYKKRVHLNHRQTQRLLDGTIGKLLPDYYFLCSKGKRRVDDILIDELISVLQQRMDLNQNEE